ncbi:MAG TPA: hypothetical protein VFX28_19605 [Methylomirabilota bacterium]|nr:hypothetical protein [Methylomirabilota bacterium]
MPPYLLHEAAWKALWPMPVAAVVVAAVLLLACDRGHRREAFVVLAAFAMLGLVTGYLTGLSRQPVVGAVLPAVLSLLGGVTAFVVGRSRESRAMVGAMLFTFALTLLVGTSWGAVMRDHGERHAQSVQALERQAYIESEVNAFRQALGLPPLAPPAAARDR